MGGIRRAKITGRFHSIGPAEVATPATGCFPAPFFALVAPEYQMVKVIIMAVDALHSRRDMNIGD